MKMGEGEKLWVAGGAEYHGGAWRCQGQMGENAGRVACC